jgi:6-phosphogluconolactonase
MDNIHIYNTEKLLADAIADYFSNMISDYLQEKDPVNIALSGGNTPLLFFTALTDLKPPISWDKTHIYWVDERCVAPDDPQSNYGMTKKYLLDEIDIPPDNIHRIFGEAEPESEVKRYSQEIMREVGSVNYWPVFDWILLGLGGDGHTASLFPGSSLLKTTNSISALAKHPETGQKRVTLTLPILNQGRNISFLVSGSSKTRIIQEILEASNKHSNYPAARIKPVNGIIDWFLDKDAAADLY